MLKVLLVLISVCSVPAFGGGEFGFPFKDVVEFRLQDNSKGWFVSFLPIELPENVQGKFEHENYGGYSYNICLEPKDEAKLNQARLVHDLFGIWDSVKCKSGKMELLRQEHSSEYILKVHSLEGCETIWDD